MRRFISLILTLTLMLSVSAAAAAAFDSTGLTWDGKSATLTEIGTKLGLTLTDSAGDYIPQSYDKATILWESGLLLGANGSFNLDMPMTRIEGVIMTLRLLGKEEAAKQQQSTANFTDVPGWAAAFVGYAAKNGIVSGYSSTRFGGNDTMTANQFLTFALRAMGYVDSVDFTWDAAADKALEIGLIDDTAHTRYTRSNLFLRDDMAAISYDALYFAPMKSGGKLIDSVVTSGKPSGQVPTAMVKTAATVKTAIEVEIRQESEYTSYESGNSAGQYVNGILMKGMSYDWVSLKIVSGSGTLTLSEIINGVSGSRNIYVEQGQSYDITPEGATYYTLICNGETYELTAGTFYYPA